MTNPHSKTCRSVAHIIQHYTDHFDKRINSSSGNSFFTILCGNFPTGTDVADELSYVAVVLMRTTPSRNSFRVSNLSLFFLQSRARFHENYEALQLKEILPNSVTALSFCKKPQMENPVFVRVLPPKMSGKTFGLSLALKKKRKCVKTGVPTAISIKTIGTLMLHVRCVKVDTVKKVEAGKSKQ